MQRNCNVCGDPYDAMRPTSKFCSPGCRVKNHQRKRSTPPPVTPAKVRNPAQQPEEPMTDNSLVKATRAELEAAGVAESLLGQQALRIAAQMSGFETAGGMASLSKELSRVMAEAMRSAAPLQVDSVDELKARREAKRAG